MKDFLKGLLIGLGKVIPGVSGSVIAISLGIYERLIKSLDSFYKKESMIFLTKVGIGILLSIVFGSKIVAYFLNNYYNPTCFLFIGLILGSLKEVTFECKSKYWLWTLLSFGFVFSLDFLNIQKVFLFQNNFEYIYFGMSGFFDAFASIVPGISGTAILMIFGSYEKIVEMFSNILNIDYIFSNFYIIFSFFIGVLLGTFVFVKIINFLFKKYYHQTYNAILGFVIGSVLILLKSTQINIYSFIFLLLGFFIIKKINHFFG